jgi:hypothetical protein
MIIATATGFFSAGAAAQTRPDFAGQWVRQDTAVTEAARGGRAGGARGRRTGDMGSGWGPDIAITQDANQLIVEYAFFARGDMQAPLRFVYALNGSETKNSVMMGRGIQVQTSRTAWAGEKLVITTKHSFPHPETGQPMTSEMTQTLSLESPGSLLVETVRSGVLDGPPSTTRTVYRKR